MGRTREEVVRVAGAQKLLLWAILTSLVGNVLLYLYPSFVMRLGLPIEITRILFLLPLPLSLFIVIFQIFGAVKLARALHYGWWTLLLAIVQIVPCLSLLTLLVMNSKATALLQECGIRVGLMGANRSDVERYRPVRTTCPGCGEELDHGVTLCPVCGQLIPSGNPSP